MKYCFSCKSQECKYIELEYFIKYIEESQGQKFVICDCPDKSGQTYTCDLVLENQHSEKMYVEIKDIICGVNSNTEISENIGQSYYAYLINEAINEMTENKRIWLKRYSIKIPQKQIYKDEQKDFTEKLKVFLKEKNFESISTKLFVYERKKEKVQIEFEPKKSSMNKFGDDYLFEYQLKEPITLDELLKKTSDFHHLKNQLVLNCKNTSKKKFPNVKEHKLLLNILKFPIGQGIFFEQNMKAIVNKFRSCDADFKCDADEIYLLYYSDNYYMDIGQSGKIKSYGKVLFILHLVSKNKVTKNYCWYPFIIKNNL